MSKKSITNRIKIYLYYIVIITFFLSHICLAQNIKEISEFVKDDRILILAPHPDDEAIATGGVIQRALKAGAKIKIVCFTNGDHNQLAFIVYEKRLTFRKREFIHMGEIRRKETIKAMESLGLNQDDIIFLGYPDFGTMEILTEYWGKIKPFKSLLTRISKVPYSECLSPDAPYVGDAILNDLRKVVLDFKPTKIFVSHPIDTNRDHQSLYLFLQVTLWDLDSKIDRPQIFPYVIHIVGWPKPRGYHPELELNPPKKITEISWQGLSLTEDEIKAKYKAISFYKSQIEYEPPYLFTFARKNEIFGDYPPVKLKKQDEKEIHWQDLKINENIEISQSIKREENQTDNISNLAYGIDYKNLYIRLTLKRKIDKDFGASVFLLGYSRKSDFSSTPKIRLNVGVNGLHIKDKKQTLFIKDVQLRYQDKTLVIKVPFLALGNPDYILGYARTNTGDLSLDETAWRIIEIE